MKLLLVGMNHRSAPLELRERMAVEEPGPVLQKLVTSDESSRSDALTPTSAVTTETLLAEPAASSRKRSVTRLLDCMPGGSTQRSSMRSFTPDR